jgi:hypothetical protein
LLHLIFAQSFLFHSIAETATPTMEKQYTINVQQALPFTSTSAQAASTKEWARMLHLVHPTITTSTTRPNVLVHKLNPDDGRQVVIGYASVLPTALLQSRIHAWSWVSSERLDHAHALYDALCELSSCVEKRNPATAMIVVQKGTQRRLRFEDDMPGCMILEGRNDAETELFVHVLSEISGPRPGTTVAPVTVPELAQRLVDGTTSVLAMLSTDAIGVSLDKAAARVSIQTCTEPDGEGKTCETMFTSIDGLVAQMMSDIGEANPEMAKTRTHCVHAALFNGVSQLESWIVLGSIHKACVASGGNSPGRLTTSAVPYQDCPRMGFGLASVSIPGTLACPNKVDGVINVPSPTPKDAVASTEVLQQQSRSDPPPSSQVTGPPSHASPATNRLQERIRAACNALLTAEPDITKYDTLTGDGDCGLTLSAGARSVLAILPSLDLSLCHVAESIDRVVDELENAMGGTSGALYCIFLSALAAQLRAHVQPSDSPRITAWSSALAAAMVQLFDYTRARRGDRTCIDALDPFVSALVAGEGETAACDAAEKGARDTAQMQPRLGRSTYLSAEACVGIPDAGAWGLAILLREFCSVPL